ncbi:xanthine dehydrogenase family protein molybdopterin-binding subunit [Spirochaeta lutea]|uniref:Aldehyde oxidase/xanthine dehydrogenase a/b hammerhead domain-containing protein n=1 Tax=Spirochaeta lutea TaxID=1480694 RepID=A0A098QVL0_9SPIO|nr:molybdopterin cofactor-binding domain-containing protein [Spirochaeta lutea]KGE71428.1 hypothetical protein DC28_11595 [Spirochaeta lutea]
MAKIRSVRSTLTSRSRFITDLPGENALACRFLRSEKARAKILRIHIPEESRLKEVRGGVLLPGDLPGARDLEFFGNSLPLFAEDEVFFQGQPIGLVYAPSQADVDAILQEIQVIYEELPGEFIPKDSTVFTTRRFSWFEPTWAEPGPAAANPRLPDLQGENPSEDDSPEQPGTNTAEDGSDTEILPEVQWLDSGSEEGMDDSNSDNPGDSLESEIQDTSIHEIHSQLNLHSQFQPVRESLGAYCYLHDGILVVRTPAIWPHHLQRSITQICKLQPRRVDVQPTIPGMYHDRLLIDSEIVALGAALCTIHTGNPALLVLDPEEEMLTATKQAVMTCSHSLRVDAETGLDEVRITYRINMGAFPLFTQEILRQVAVSSLYRYRCPKGLVEVELHRTNLQPMSIFHGFLSPQAQTCTEIQMNRAAEVLNVDPMELRLGLLLHPGEQNPTGAEFPNPEEVFTILPRLGEISDFSRKFSAFEVLRKSRSRQENTLGRGLLHQLRGIGMALGFQGNGFTRPTEQYFKTRVRLRLETDGTIKLYASSSPGSSSLKAHWRDMVREFFDVPEESIELVQSNTLEVPDAGPSSVSRNITIMRKLIEQSCKTLQRQRFREPLPLEIVKTYRPSTRGSWDDEQFSGNPYYTTSWAGAAVEVGVDPVTYQPSVTGVWVVVNAGGILYNSQARAHIEGSVIQTLSWALNQRWDLERTRLVPHLATGHSPTGLSRTPPIHVEFIEPEGFTGLAKRRTALYQEAVLGIGELAQSAIPAALLSALSQATGQYFDQIPITPELIHHYMEEV